LQEIAVEPGSREYWAGKYGQVWDTGELAGEFEVLGFRAPYCVVRRRSDNQMGSVEFAHSPRFYFRFEPHHKEGRQ
jgi:hypothetical protein